MLASTDPQIRLDSPMYHARPCSRLAWPDGTTIGLHDVSCARLIALAGISAGRVNGWPPYDIAGRPALL
jgi:hypothetical protein